MNPELNSILRNPLEQLHQKFLDEITEAQDLSNLDSYQKFTRETAKALAAPLKQENNIDDLFKFLDSLFRASIEFHKNMVIGLTSNDYTNPEIVIDKFIETADPKEIKLLHQFGFNFEAEHYHFLFLNIGEASCKEDFKKQDWLNTLGLILDKELIQKPFPNNEYSILHNEAFPIPNNDSGLNEEIIDLILEKGYDIFQRKEASTFATYLRYQPHLIKHLLDNHPKLFENQDRIIETAHYALTGMLKSVNDPYTDENLDREMYILDAEELKESFDLLRQAGINLNEVRDDILNPAQHLNSLKAKASSVSDDAAHKEIMLRIEQIEEDLGF